MRDEQSDTPTTDAVHATLRGTYYAHSFSGPYDVMRDHANQLEHSLQQALDVLRDALTLLEGYEDVLDSADGPVPNAPMHVANSIRAFLADK